MDADELKTAIAGAGVTATIAAVETVGSRTMVRMTQHGVDMLSVVEGLTAEEAAAVMAIRHRNWEPSAVAEKARREEAAASIEAARQVQADEAAEREKV